MDTKGSCINFIFLVALLSSHLTHYWLLLESKSCAVFQFVNSHGDLLLFQFTAGHTLKISIIHPKWANLKVVIQSGAEFG